MKKLLFIQALCFIFLITLFSVSCKKENTKDNNDNNNEATITITDIDGNVYNTVTIGTQTWMRKNLKVTHSNNGILISNITDSLIWPYLTTPARCYYKNDSITYSNTYGALYNWYAVNDSNLCPLGWHIPSNSEWTILETYLGGYSVAGSKMKEKGTTHWVSPNIANNASGFTGLPGGDRYSNGAYLGIGFFGDWWSSTGGSSGTASFVELYNNSESFLRFGGYKHAGFSVRCIKN